jgi:hypothetical protein
MEAADFARIQGRTVTLSHSRNGVVQPNLTYMASSAAVISAMTLTAGVYDWFKLELGDTATPFQPRLIAEETALCRRYFQIAFPNSAIALTGTGTTVLFMTLQHPLQMRVNPTATISGTNTGTVWNLADGNQMPRTFSNPLVFEQTALYWSMNSAIPALRPFLINTSFNMFLDAEV